MRMSEQDAVALGARLGAERVEAERMQHGAAWVRARRPPGVGWGETAWHEGVHLAHGVPKKHHIAFLRAYSTAAHRVMDAMEEEPPFAVIAYTRAGRVIWRGIRSCEEAKQRRCGEELRHYKVCEVVPEALADILGRMYDDDPDVAWDADLHDDIDRILRRDGFVRGGVSMRWAKRHAATCPAAAALNDIVNVLHPPDDPNAAWGPDTSQAIEQVLVRHGFVPRPRPQQRARARR